MSLIDKELRLGFDQSNPNGSGATGIYRRSSAMAQIAAEIRVDSRYF